MKSVEMGYSMQESLAKVTNTGEVIWVSAVRLLSRCEVDLTTFPFDEQTCKVKFGSWTYHGHEVNLTYYGDQQGSLSVMPNSNRDRTVVKSSAVTNTLIYGCCPEPYLDLTVFLDSLKKYGFLDEPTTPLIQGFDNSAVSYTDLEGIQQQTEDTPTPTSKQEKDREQLYKYLYVLTKASLTKESRQRILDEWRQVEVVIDRILVVVFFLIFIISSCILLI